MLVSADRQAKQQLASGERKSITTDRVILVPGPLQELQCVRDIYRMLVSEGRTVYAIARELNRKGVMYLGDSKWDYLAVSNILTHPKYAGCHVFGQAIFPNQISIARRGGRWRSRLRLRNRLSISVLIARPFRAWKDTIRWLVDPVQHERKLVTLLARLNVNKDAFLDFYILPNVDRRKRFSISLRDVWLNRAERLTSLSTFCEATERVQKRIISAC